MGLRSGPGAGGREQQAAEAETAVTAQTACQQAAKCRAVVDAQLTANRQVGEQAEMAATLRLPFGTLAATRHGRESKRHLSLGQERRGTIARQFARQPAAMCCAAIPMTIARLGEQRVEGSVDLGVCRSLASMYS